MINMIVNCSFHLIVYAHTTYKNIIF